MKVKVEVKGNKIIGWYGLFTQKDRDIIDESFKLYKMSKYGKVKNGIHYIEVKSFNE